MKESKVIKTFIILFCIAITISCDERHNDTLFILSNLDKHPSFYAIKNISRNNLSIKISDLNKFEDFINDIKNELSVTLDSNDIEILNKIYQKYQYHFEDAILKKYGISVFDPDISIYNSIYSSIMYRYVLKRFGSSILGKITNDIDSIYSNYFNIALTCLKEGSLNSIINNKDYVFQLDDILNFDININLPMYSKGFDSLISIEIPFVSDSVNEINDGLIVNFVVNNKGIIGDIWVSSKLSKIHDSIACDIIKKMDKWYPAVFNGKKVNYRVSLTIDFIPKSMIENERYRLQKHYKKLLALDSSFKQNELNVVPFW